MTAIDESKAILVWPFYAAPKEFKALSQHGGDEGWLAFIPNGEPDRLPSWMESGTPFGCCDVEVHTVNGGSVAIGAHA
jgi:hypothetical protein